jgi:hypothetical protein
MKTLYKHTLTISVKLGQNGVSYAEGRGIVSAEDNEVGTYSIN